MSANRCSKRPPEGVFESVIAKEDSDAELSHDGYREVSTEKDLEMEEGLEAMEVHGRLVLLAHVELRVESALCY